MKSLAVAFMLIGSLMTSQPVWARPMEPFSADSFAIDQKNSKRIAVLFYAWWNKYSRDEKSAVQVLTDIKAYSGLKTYIVDFSDTKLRKKFNVDKVSTLIIFLGEQELGRDSALIDGDAVEELIRKAY